MIPKSGNRFSERSCSNNKCYAAQGLQELLDLSTDARSYRAEVASDRGDRLPIVRVAALASP